MQMVGNPAFCVTSGDSAVLIVQPADSIQWLKDNSAITGATGTRLSVIQSGSYSALLFSDEGCSISTRVEEIFVESPRPAQNYPIQYAVINNPIQLQSRTFGTSVLWRPSTYLDNVNIVNPQFNSPLSDEEFIYTINITTATGCETVDTQIVKTIKEVKVYVPTAFTPNNDGLNDFLKPLMFGVKEMQYFRVYNRWGQLVYDMRGSQQGWNGSIAGQSQSTATFVWIFQGLGLDNKIYRQKGTVTVIR
jgi:gliding motility-associated-like protein